VHGDNARGHTSVPKGDMTRVLGVGLIGMILVGQSHAVYSTYRTDTSCALVPW
jgi:hypothetical protein